MGLAKKTSLKLATVELQSIANHPSKAHSVLRMLVANWLASLIIQLGGICSRLHRMHIATLHMKTLSIVNEPLRARDD
jgi:hypothetical protein